MSAALVEEMQGLKEVLGLALRIIYDLERAAVEV